MCNTNLHAPLIVQKSNKSVCTNNKQHVQILIIRSLKCHSSHFALFKSNTAEVWSRAPTVDPPASQLVYCVHLKQSMKLILSELIPPPDVNTAVCNERLVGIQ